jgi:inhibitor of KinA
VNDRVHALAAAVRRARTSEPGLGAPVPAYASLLVPYDPLRLDGSDVAARLASLMDAHVIETAEGSRDRDRLVEIPTRYGGRDGPDLDEVAALHGMRTAQVVEAHTSVEYQVHFVGFAPGFAYLGSVPAVIATPRHPTPRPRVPAGSVGIADRQTGVYPLEGPGGWRLIGRTGLRIWDVRRDPPALLLPGSRARFIPLAGADAP